MSVLFTRTADGDETRLLVEAAAGRFVFASRQGPSGPDTHESIRSVNLGEELARRLLLSGPQGEPACKGIAAPDACIVVEGKNGQAVVALSRLSGEGVDALREKLLALSSGAFRSQLVALAPVFSRSLDLARYADGDFLGFLFPGVFRAGNSRGTPGGGCEFDARFGYPCSDKERRWERTKFGPRPAGES